MADGGHVAAVALLVEFDYAPARVASSALLVEFDHHVYIRIAAHALLVELDATPDPFDVAGVNIHVRGILDGVEAAEERMRLLVEGGSEASRDWSQLVSDLAGYQTDIRECRAILDAADATTALAFQSGEASIRLLQWGQGVRTALVAIELRLLEAITIATEIVGSLPSRLYAVRSGDTLQTIAARQLGDWQAWEALAAVNNIDPGPLAAGLVLVLPEMN